MTIDQELQLTRLFLERLQLEQHGPLNHEQAQRRAQVYNEIEALERAGSQGPDWRTP